MINPPTPPTYLDHNTALAYLLQLTDRIDADGAELSGAFA
ncbi:MAG: hypothetical protein JWQ02_3199 [Capsulimonas sp.]|nr:hypothetical protein [Capsulimonas sp.]